MISLIEFSEIFRRRHDFSSEDIKILESNFPHIKFKDIPDDWICEIDSHLQKIDSSGIRFIYQTMGFLHIDCQKISKRDCKVLKSLEKKLYKADIDLHEQLHEGIILN